MPAILVGTNSYVSQADAATYLDGSIRAGTIWPEVESDTQIRALISAFRLIDRLDLVYDTLPQEVKDAQCELAFELSQNAALEGNTTTGSNVRKVRADTVEVEFFSQGVQYALPKIVLDLIAKYIPALTIGGSFVSGGSDQDTFDDDYQGVLS